MEDPAEVANEEAAPASPEGDTPEEAAKEVEPTTISLTITFNPVGRQVAINGPIQDKLLCYGLLEMARDIIGEFSALQRAKEAARQLVPQKGFRGYVDPRLAAKIKE